MHKSNCFVLNLIARVSLLEIDPHVKCLILAARDGEVNVVVDILRDGSHVDCCNETALFVAAINNRSDVAKVLLENGANIIWQNRFGNTPLIHAARFNNARVMEVLLHHGADPSIVDGYGRTALGVAREKDCEEAILLLEKYWVSACQGAVKLNATIRMFCEVLH